MPAGVPGAEEGTRGVPGPDGGDDPDVEEDDCAATRESPVVRRLGKILGMGIKPGRPEPVLVFAGVGVVGVSAGGVSAVSGMSFRGTVVRVDCCCSC